MTSISRPWRGMPLFADLDEPASSSMAGDGTVPIRAAPPCAKPNEHARLRLIVREGGVKESPDHARRQGGSLPLRCTPW